MTMWRVEGEGWVAGWLTRNARQALPSTLFYLLAPFLLWPALAWAQPVPPEEPVRMLETGFEREVNRYRWIGNVEVAQAMGPWAVALTNRFSSDAYLLFGDALSFRDEDRLLVAASRPLGARLSAHLRGQTFWFGQSRVFSQDALAGLRFAPRPSWWVEPAAGLAWDQRPGARTDALGTAEPPLRRDAGPAVGGRFLWQPALPEAAVALEGEALWQFINPRRGRLVRVGGAAARPFEDVRLGATVRLASVRRDAYQAVSFLNRDPSSGATAGAESIEATTSDTLEVGLTVEAPLGRGFGLVGRLDVGANDRAVRTHGAPDGALAFDTDFRRRAVEAEVGVAREGSSWSLLVRAQTGAEVETRELVNRDALPAGQASQKQNLLRQADYDRGSLALQTRGRLAVLPRIVVSFDGRASIYRLDTPDINPDDRDEAYHTAQLGVLVHLSRYAELDVRTFGSFTHTVYLNAQRSAENNVQRSLRLRPAVRLRPSERLRLELASEVRATYTVDDFVLPGRRPRDQSAREHRYDLNADLDLGGGLRLRAEAGVSDLHLGRLLWDSFAEIPFDTLRTVNLWARLQAPAPGGATAEIGLRAFLRRDYDRALSVQYPLLDATGAPVLDASGLPIRESITRPGRRRIEQIGPTCALLWPMRGGSTLRLDGWLNVQHVRRRLYGDLPEPDAEVIRRTGHAGTRAIIPNLAMTMTWRF